jgi:hypothetical protein
MSVQLASTHVLPLDLLADVLLLLRLEGQFDEDLVQLLVHCGARQRGRGVGRWGTEDVPKLMQSCSKLL